VLENDQVLLVHQPPETFFKGEGGDKNWLKM